MNDPHGEKFGWIAAVLLVIPGFALVGIGAGLVLDNPAPWTIIGLGAGLSSWGLVVALQRR